MGDGSTDGQGLLDCYILRLPFLRTFTVYAGLYSGSLHTNYRTRRRDTKLAEVLYKVTVNVAGFRKPCESVAVPAAVKIEILEKY